MADTLTYHLPRQGDRGTSVRLDAYDRATSGWRTLAMTVTRVGLLASMIVTGAVTAGTSDTTAVDVDDVLSRAYEPYGKPGTSTARVLIGLAPGESWEQNRSTLTMWGVALTAVKKSGVPTAFVLRQTGPRLCLSMKKGELWVRANGVCATRTVGEEAPSRALTSALVLLQQNSLGGGEWPMVLPIEGYLMLDGSLAPVVGDGATVAELAEDNRWRKRLKGFIGDPGWRPEEFTGERPEKKVIGYFEVSGTRSTMWIAVDQASGRIIASVRPLSQEHCEATGLPSALVMELWQHVDTPTVQCPECDTSMVTYDALPAAILEQFLEEMPLEELRALLREGDSPERLEEEEMSLEWWATFRVKLVDLIARSEALAREHTSEDSSN